MTTLNTQYFELLEKRQQNDVEYQAYRCKWPASTAVLFTQTTPPQPLCALTFGVTERNVRTLMTRRSDCPSPEMQSKGYTFFQALASKNGTSFGFCITNLTHFKRDSLEGFLKVDILAEDTNVREVDLPTKALNKWNELRPSESAMIESDQRSGNRVMTLCGAVDAKTQKIIKAGEDEAQANGQLGTHTAGTYLHINVVPDTAFPEMVSLFENGTRWQCCDVFVRQVSVMGRAFGSVPTFLGSFNSPLIRTPPYNFTALERFLRNAGYVPSVEECGVDFNQQIYELVRYDGALLVYNDRSGFSFGSVGNERWKCVRCGKSGSSTRELSHQCRVSSEFFGERNCNRCVAGEEEAQKNHSSIVYGRRRRRRFGGTPEIMTPFYGMIMGPIGINTGETFESTPIMRGGGSGFACSSSASPTGFSFGANNTPFRSQNSASRSFQRPQQQENSSRAVDITGTEVRNAQAGQLVPGSRVVPIETTQTGHSYAYNRRGERMVLGLSVYSNLPSYDAMTCNEAKEEARIQLTDLLQYAGKALLESLERKFVSDCCVICIDRPPSIVLMQCGHQCICSQCLPDTSKAPKKCYLCRARVTAAIAVQSL